MRKNVKKQLALRVLSTAALMAMVSSIATAAFADTYDLNTGSVTVETKDDGITYVTQQNTEINDHADTTGVTITSNGKPTSNTITVETADKQTTNVTLENVHIEQPDSHWSGNTDPAPIEIKGNGDTYLELNGNNTVLSGSKNHAGIEKADVNGTGTLTISGTGRMTNFTSDSPAPWADQADQITNVEVEGTVTSIGAVAFKGCTNLTTVNIADGVEYIEAGAFNGCTALTDITIPESVGYIKTGAFKDCNALTSVTIRDNCRLDMNVFPTTVEVNHSEG